MNFDSSTIPWAGAGVGLAALENRMVGDNLPEPLKRVNLGIGGISGLMLGSHNPEAQIAALTGIPLKEMALFGIGSMDKMRRTQQGLVDTNLQTARTNLHTAKIQGRDAGSRKALTAAFLLPALATGGAAAYMGYEHWKKNHQPKDKRFATIDSQGKPPAHQKVRIDIPPSALPRDFFTSLKGLGDNSRAYAQLQDNDSSMPPVNRNRKRNENMKKAAMFQKLASPHPSLLGTVGNLAAEFTGLPSLGRSLSDTSSAYRSLENGDHREALRYGLGALGGGAMGLSILRGKWGPLGLLGQALGKARLGGVIGRGAKGFMSGGLGRQFTEAPTFAKTLMHDAFGNELNPRMNAAGEIMQTAKQRMALRGQIASGEHIPTPSFGTWNAAPSTTGSRPDLDKVYAGMPDSYRTPGAIRSRMSRGPHDRLLDMKGRYDPQAMAWDNPTPASGIGFKSFFNRFLTNPANRDTPPPMGLIGQGVNTLRYGANRLANAGYAINQFGKRNPNLRLMALGMPLQGMGIEHDQERLNQANDDLKGYRPDYMNNKGPYGMPVSSALSGLMSGITGVNPDQGFADQMSGTKHDPYHIARFASTIL